MEPPAPPSASPSPSLRWSSSSRPAPTRRPRSASTTGRSATTSPPRRPSSRCSAPSARPRAPLRRRPPRAVGPGRHLRGARRRPPRQLVPRLREPGAAAAWVRSALSHVPAATSPSSPSATRSSPATTRPSPRPRARHGRPPRRPRRGRARGRVAVTTAHSLAVLASSVPALVRRVPARAPPLRGAAPRLHARTRSPFLVNAYPYFAYKADPERVDIDYALFGPTRGGGTPARACATRTCCTRRWTPCARRSRARGRRRGGEGEVEVVVSETGWPSAGDEGEAGATPENAARYNGNLMRMVAEGRGTPRARQAAAGYVFALFNENLKPGPASERHYGLFNPTARRLRPRPRPRPPSLPELHRRRSRMG
uniref:Glucan endo-1,3-beta-D-glucosidase n=1 Tax=Ananas comosus var. bracteatus TaxID=296719 RepID=A0A6V7QCI6_ANACO|nr:unnamed protein product [Ananas comosus var. bracteatus]